MRIAFFGEDAFSLIVLESLVKAGHSIVGVYCPVYSNFIYKRLYNYCDSNSISFNRLIDFKDNKLQETLSNFDLDLIIVCHFQKILAKELFQIPKKGSINLHPSLLPFYRGMSPQHWPIINGDLETGVTVHFIDEGVDTGDIIIQKKLPIQKDIYVYDLQNEMRKIYSTILVEAVDQIQNDTINLVKQSHLNGSYFGRLKLNQCTLKKEMSKFEAYNLVRGVSFPYFGARFDNSIIWKASIVDNNHGLIFDADINFDAIIQHESGSYINFVDGLLKLEQWEKI
jgi:methionyl-tRNA formyltransferase